MNIFPIIKHIDDYLPHIAGKDYIGVNKQDNGSTVVCYNISNGTAFKTSHEKESRGITFDPNGNIIARPLHKFFNLAEREEVLPQNLDFNLIMAGFNKMDGSMITSGFIDDKFFVKSKKSFKSDVAVAAEKFSYANQKYIDFTKYCSLAMLTPIFEFTSPEHRIVLRYADENMTILHIRDTINGTYLTPFEIESLSVKFDIPYNRPIFGAEMDMNSLVKSLNTVEGIEGYVIQFQNGEMIKIKTKWYMDLHHVVTFKRMRDIANMVVEETIDDFIGYLSLNAPEADMSQVHQINNFINEFINEMKKEVIELSTPFMDLPLKDAAIAMKGHKYFGFVMNHLRNQVPDYLGYYKAFYLKEHWSLDEIDLGNLGDFKIGNSENT
jgi:RNA ligase